MHIGTQFHAEDGLGSLVKGERYYYCGRTPNHGVLLIWFKCDLKNRWKAYSIHMPDHQFEIALTSAPPTLKPIPNQRRLPEWLKEVEGVNFEELEPIRRDAKITYREQVEARLRQIEPLLQNEVTILVDANPIATAKSLARRLNPQANSARASLWFFAYLLHGRNIWSLKAPTHHLGTWDRGAPEHRMKRLGRPSKDRGHLSGWSGQLLIDQVEASYLKRVKLGKPMSTIFREAMVDDFGCDFIEDDYGQRRYFHPENKPFPSYGQFRYLIVKKFGLDDVRRAKYGAARQRNRAIVDLGQYTNQYASILENIEVDAYRCDDRPKAFYSDEPMPPLVVARAICTTTSACVGVGFSLQGETKQAYRSMLLCMAMPKDIIAKIFGIDPKILQWPMHGLSRSVVSDRGPAGHNKLVEDLEARFPVKTITESYAGQSKPQVEASNPRSVKLEGAPNYVHSELHLPEMMRRELLRAVAQNRSKNIAPRLDNEAVKHFAKNLLVATPQNYWDYLEQRMRTSATDVAWEDAVRTYAARANVTLDRVGVLLETQYYKSAEFVEGGHHEALVRTGISDLVGYYIPMAVRYIWIEVRGRLFELEAVKRVRQDNEELYVPFSELVNVSAERAILQSRTRNVASAERSYFEKEFKTMTGKEWDAGRRRSGTPGPATGTTAQEVRVLKGNKRRTG